MQEYIDVSKLLLDFYNFEPLSIDRITGYDDLNYVVECIDLNSDSKIKGKYVLKVVNANDSEQEGLTAAIMHVIGNLPQLGFETPKPVTCSSGGYVSLLDTSLGVRKVVLISYISGLDFKSLKFEAETFLQFCYEIGLCAGRLTSKLIKIKDPDSALKRVNDFYVIQYMHMEHERLKLLKNENIRNICSYIMSKFKNLEESYNSDPHSGIRKGVIHNDMCLENFIFNEILDCKSQQRYTVKGIIDFSDMAISYYMFEAAVTIASTMYQTFTLRGLSPYRAGKSTLYGFETNFVLNNEEKAFLYYAVLARFVSLRVIGGYDTLVSDKTAEHEMHDLESLDYFIEFLWKHGKTKFDEEFFDK